MNGKLREKRKKNSCRQKMTENWVKKENENKLPTTRQWTQTKKKKELKLKNQARLKQLQTEKEGEEDKKRKRNVEFR